ncbi:MAG: CDP-alcohol phosphatidyltransferase family protein [Akkermansiaceae bacterium]|jgi:CDP-diacylglycerol--glycerol-3-phosphate 3-phosphatidyltransferase
MTLATKITILRLFLVPLFATLAIAYSLKLDWVENPETLRWAALSVFTIAALSDWLDGWLARNCNQASELGAFLDPIADKLLVFSAIMVLTFFKWDNDGWAIPIWFAALVILRDCLILIGIKILYTKHIKVKIKPHWTGKACTVSLFLVIGWVMLKAIPFSPIYPCIVAAFFLLWSAAEYLRQGLAILKQSKTT